MKKYFLVGLTLALALVVMGASSPLTLTIRSQQQLNYKLVATNPRVNRLVIGDVTADVDGVPAEPVHSFVWDGNGSTPVKGYARYEIDPVANTGRIVARWVDKHGVWKFEQTAFAPPEHPSGLRVGPGADDRELVEGDPIPVDVYLHGDTSAGGPVLPTLFNHLATWGPAKVTLNGEPFENPYDGPAPLWVAHTMTSAGARNEDGQVLTVDGEFFNPSLQDEGAVDYDDIEFHLVFHDAPGPETDNFPPPLSFFYHLTFENVSFVVQQGD